jgi:hypothetical protein
MFILLIALRKRRFMPPTDLKQVLFDKLNVNLNPMWTGEQFIDFNDELRILFEAMGAHPRSNLKYINTSGRLGRWIDNLSRDGAQLCEEGVCPSDLIISRADFEAKAASFGLNAADFKDAFGYDGDINNLSMKEFICAAKKLNGQNPPLDIAHWQFSDGINKNWQLNANLTREEFFKTFHGNVTQNTIDAIDSVLHPEVSKPKNASIGYQIPKVNFADLQRLAADNDLTLENSSDDKIDVSRLVVSLASDDLQKSQDINYKFGIEQIGESGYSSLCVSASTKVPIPFDKLAKFMDAIRQNYLQNKKFKSIVAKTHGGKGAQLLGASGSRYNIIEGIAPKSSDKLAPQSAPFYKYTEHLIIDGCLALSELTQENVKILCKLAKLWHVRIDGDTTVYYRIWGARYDNSPGYQDDQRVHNYYMNDGMGGNAFAFLPDGSIAKILRPGDYSTYMSEANDPLISSRGENVWNLELAWREQGGKFIDQRDAPNQAVIAPYNKQTIVFHP